MEAMINKSVLFVLLWTFLSGFGSTNANPILEKYSTLSSKKNNEQTPNTTQLSPLSYSRYANQSYPTNVYWGDTHLHTNLSLDAYSDGNKKLGPEEAYRFAKGEAVIANNGMKARLHKPLDFLVVADHASNMGVMNGLEAKDPTLLTTEVGKRWLKNLNELADLAKTDPLKYKKLSRQFMLRGFGKDVVGSAAYEHSVWKKVTELADKYNDPGQFTTLIGFEWTPIEFNLHRVVIFKDNADKVQYVRPFSQYDSKDPEDLWIYLESYQTQTGGEVLAIPHNGNLSSGVMFALEDAKGNPLSTQYAKSRSRWEPLFEVTQIKGDSETHPVISPNDQFADYETWSSKVLTLKEIEDYRSEHNYNGYKNWYDTRIRNERNPDWMRTYEYVRSALKLGLDQQAKLGANPFKIGMIGSTDSHTSLSTADDNNFWGKLSWFEPNKHRITDPYPSALGRDVSAAGYAAVWATENTRQAIFDAMKRKETYATTGPRMTVRFFGGWDYQKDDALKPDLARIGYRKGVPMGGDLTSAPQGQSPNFLIRAVKDPDGANLDRVQVIKGWHDKKGELHEKIYNVALSDGRQENWRGKVKPVGNTVDIKEASYTNTIGDPELAVVWTDPDFNQDELAFYYVRVLEIPTPRWTAYDAKFFGLKALPKEVPMVTQERAYTSPIWFSPSVRQ